MKIMLVFGTRPEAIKMCPLVKELKSRAGTEVFVCTTGQHRDMLAQVMSAFDTQPDRGLEIMRENQTLFDITTEILTRLPDVISAFSPDILLVHGDTTTAFAASLAAFYLGVPVAHVEAGLRSGNLRSPFPEEYNRRAVSLSARLHFAPTEAARDNLLSEGVDGKSIFVTGNTAIDALKTTVREDFSHPEIEWARGSDLLLVTAHRRENIGGAMEGMFRALLGIVRDFPTVKVIMPVHPNPKVGKTAEKILGAEERIRRIPPMGPIEFHNFMARCRLVLTDSGGIQEEAPALDKPVIVMRDTTERPEGVAAGTLRLVGTDPDTIYRNCAELLTDHAAYEKMARAVNPYGDGKASARIADILLHG